MMTRKAAIAALAMLGATTGANAADSSAISAMQIHITRMRVMTESCQLQFDPKVYTDYLGVLLQQGADIVKVQQDLDRAYNEERSRPAQLPCPSDYLDQLSRLNRIYRSMLDGIRQG
ncbi:hypothetical protein GFL39_25840 [Rhizobium leguminosarum bv. viciae]|uniref:hypothetical protein n=1 Tax=Rhizobium leguminosarum TaxID=384 RepID=UPI001441EC8E|nr:hypothetical protein [Rhizobium leguminosarum]NKL08294.1 hypothetical protein [Rhizobium leguminosarum bv. viciae]